MKKLYVEIAKTPEQRETGLMYRKQLARNRGMLFKFDKNSYLSFWMQNTYLPLDIAFLNEKGEILQIESMAPLSTRSVRASKPCKFALEVNKGWFQENKITVGQAITGNMFNQQPPVEQPAQTEQTELAPIEPPDNLSIRQILEQATAGQKFTMLYFDDDVNMVLPPRVISAFDNGFEFKRGKDDELVVVYDESPAMEGHKWENKGPGVKTFKLKNIVKLEPIEPVKPK